MKDLFYPAPQIGHCYIVLEDDEWLEDEETIGHFHRRGNNPSSKIGMKKGDIIKIVSGQFYGTHGISNFWSWRRFENGEWSETIYNGYGGAWEEV